MRGSHPNAINTEQNARNAPNSRGPRSIRVDQPCLSNIDPNLSSPYCRLIWSLSGTRQRTTLSSSASTAEVKRGSSGLAATPLVQVRYSQSEPSVDGSRPMRAKPGNISLAQAATPGTGPTARSSPSRTGAQGSPTFHLRTA